MAYIEIGGPLHSIASGNIVAYTEELFDKNLNKRQSVINLEVSEKILQAVKTIEYDEENDVLNFKNFKGDIVYSLDLSHTGGGGGVIKNIIARDGKLIIKYNNDTPDLAVDIFVKENYYSKSEIDDLQENTWPIDQQTLDNLLDELDLNTED